MNYYMYRYMYEIENIIRKNPPNGVMLAMKSTEKQTLSFQETTQLVPV